MLGAASVLAYQWPLDGINICQMTVYAFWQLSCVHFLHPTISEKNKNTNFKHLKKYILQRKSTRLHVWIFKI